MRRVAWFLIAFALAAPHARADEITLPPLEGNSGSCWPLGCGLRIRSAIRIDALTIFNTTTQSAEGTIEAANYRFSLSTTKTSSATLGLDMSRNVGRNSTLVFTMNVATPGFFPPGTTRTFALTTPFVFSPFDGNLLLDIQKDRTINEGDGPVFVNVNTNAAGVATAIDEIGPNGLGGNSGPLLLRNVAMNVGFSGEPFGPKFAPTPEPASWLLIASGLAGIALRRRRQRDAI